MAPLAPWPPEWPCLLLPGTVIVKTSSPVALSRLLASSDLVAQFRAQLDMSDIKALLSRDDVPSAALLSRAASYPPTGHGPLWTQPLQHGQGHRGPGGQ